MRLRRSAGLIARRARRIPLVARIALGVLLSHFTPWTSRAIAANTEKDMLTTATDLTAGASYSGGGTPGATWDATFTNATYGATTFTVNTALTLGTLNDLDATQALIITNNGAAARTLTLSGGGDTVAGSATADLIYLAANGSLTIQNGTKTLGLVLASDGSFDTGAGATLAISSIISGNFNLTKTGAGMLTLSGANTFGGAGKTFTLTGGTLNINAAAALGNASNGFLINGGTTIDNTSGAAITMGNYALTINGDFTFAGGGATTAHDLNLGTGAVTLGTGAGAARTITTTAANSTLTIGGIIGNGTTANSVIKSGAGTLVFSGVNTYTGATTVNAGTLRAGSTQAFGVNGATTVNNGGTLDLNGKSNTVGSLTGAAGGIVQSSTGAATLTTGTLGTSTAFAGTLQNGTGPLSLVQNGAGTLTLSGTNTYTGTTTVSAGALLAGSAQAFGVNSAVTVGATGTLDLGGYGNTLGSLTGAAGGIVQSTGGAATLTTGGLNTATTFSGVLQNGTGTLALIKNGTATMTLAGAAANTFTGLTTVNTGELDLNKTAGVVAIGGNLTIGDGAGGANADIVKALATGQIASTSAVLINGGSGTLNLNNFSQTISSLADTGTVAVNGSSVALGSATLTVGDGTNTTFSGAITGTGALTKQGAGTLTLGGTTTANSFTGLTTVNGGELDLNKTAGTLAIGGSLTIGNGVGGANSDIVKLLASNQIVATAAVLINGSTGTLNLNGNSQTIGSLGDTGTVTAGGSSVSLGGGTLTVGNTTSTTFSGAITGTGGSLAKLGAGTLTLAGTNTYTGTTSVSAGVLLAASAQAFGVNSAATVGATGTLDLGGNSITLGSLAGAVGGIVQSTGGTATLTTGGLNTSTAFSGVLQNGTGTLSLIQNGTGTLTLSGTAANTFTGNTTVLAGTLLLSKSANVNAIAGGTLLVGSSTGGGGSATVLLAANGQIANAVNVSVLSSGIFSLNNFTDTIAALTLQSDTAQSASVTTGTGALTLGGNVTLNTNGTGATGATFTGNLNLGNAARTFTIAQGSAMPAYDLLVSGVISSTTAASGSIVKNGAGTLQFAGTAANTYTGLTTVNAGELDLNKSAGVLAVAGNLTIGDGTGGANSDIVKLLANGQIAATSAVLINASSGSLNLNGFTQTISSLADTGTVAANGSSVNLGAGTLTVGDTTSTTFSGNITGTGGSVAKNGTGTLSLAGSNTYSGTTTINAGTLSLNASAAFPTSGNLTMLGGTFDIHGTSPTVGNITFGDGTVTAQTTLADSGTVKGAINLTGGIAYNGTSARTFPPAIINTALVLSPGLHSLTNPNGYYSTAASYDIVFNGVISGSGGISKDGPSNLFWVVFNAANTYTGPTNVTAGDLYLGVPNALPPTTAVTVSSGASLILNAPTTEVGVTAGNYSQTIGSLSGAGTVSLGSATLTTGSDNTSTTFSGTVTGTGGITKVGTGIQTLSGTNSYTGATLVSGGELIVSGSLAATAITVNSGATLYVPGTLAGSTVTVNAGGSVSGSGAFGSSSSATGGVVNVGGGAINLVDGAISTLTITGNSSGATAVTLTLGGAAGVTSALDLETGTGSTDKVAVLQKAQVNAGGAVINLTPLAGTVLGAGTYPLVTYASDTLTGAYSLGTTTGNGGFTYALAHTATAENLVVTAVATPATAYWNGGQGAVWNAFATASNTTNWSTTAAATANTNQLPAATTDVYFAITSGAANLTNTLGADFSIHSLNFTAGSASATIGGTNNLTIGAGGISSVTGAGAQTIATNLILGASETWTVNGGAITVSGTSITGTGNNLTIAGSGNMVIGAALQTGAGTLTKTGAGTLTLSGANTYTGATNITGGTLTLGAANSLPAATSVSISSGASLNLANYTLTVASITGAGTVAIGSGALTVGDSTSVTFSGSITGTGTLTKAGTGTWSLSGTSPFSGLVIVSGGTIHVLANGALGDPEVQSGAQIVLDAGITVSSEPLILAGSGNSGAGALQAVSGAAGWNGPIQLSADASIGAASGSTLTLSGPIALSSGQTLTFLGAGTNSIAGAITGSGTLAQSGSGILVLGGVSTFTGAVAVNAGTLQFGISGALSGGPDVTVASGATLDVHDFTESIGSLAGAGSVVLGTTTGGALSAGASGASTAFSGTISGAGSFEKKGAGTLTLSSANTYTGGTTLSGGTVIAANNSAFSTGAVTFNGGGLASDNSARSLANAIVVNNVSGNQITGSNNIALTGAASGAGTLTINMSASTNTVTINPGTANSFAPAMLRLNSGTLLLGGANKIGDTTAITLNGGTLATGGFSDTMGSLAITASSVLDFGTSNTVHLQFSSASWTGGALTVENWTGTAGTTGNPDQFLIGSGPVSSSFLSEVNFQGYGPGAVAFSVGGGLYEIVPVPEPATIFGGAALLAFVGWRERRRLGRLFGKVRSEA